MEVTCLFYAPAALPARKSPQYLLIRNRIVVVAGNWVCGGTGGTSYIRLNVKLVQCTRNVCEAGNG
jgi:tetraacyldisaccharide-1-P 4'-kinase